MHGTAWRSVVTLALTAVAAGGAARPLAAQQTALARVNHYDRFVFPRPNDCVDGTHSSATAASAATSCNLQVNQGNGSASASATGSTRQVDAHAALTAYGIGTNSPGSTGFATSSGSVLYSGIPVPASLVFSYAISHGESVSGTGTSFSDDQLLLTYNSLVSGDYEYVGWNLSTYGASMFQSAGAWSDGVMALLTIPYDVGSGGLYNYSTQVQADVGVNDHDGTGSSFLTTVLNGITAVDANGNVIGQASFDAAGNATINAAVVATPEPASLLLVGSGLALVPLIRRRRRGE